MNRPQGKNMIGTFYNPKGVLVDIEMLNTLPERIFLSGIAEMVSVLVACIFFGFFV